MSIFDPKGLFGPIYQLITAAVGETVFVLTTKKLRKTVTETFLGFHKFKSDTIFTFVSSLIGLPEVSATILPVISKLPSLKRVDLTAIEDYLLTFYAAYISSECPLNNWSQCLDSDKCESLLPATQHKWLKERAVRVINNANLEREQTQSLLCALRVAPYLEGANAHLIEACVKLVNLLAKKTSEMESTWRLLTFLAVYAIYYQQKRRKAVLPVLQVNVVELARLVLIH